MDSYRNLEIHLNLECLHFTGCQHHMIIITWTKYFAYCETCALQEDVVHFSQFNARTDPYVLLNTSASAGENMPVIQKVHWPCFPTYQ